MTEQETIAEYYVSTFAARSDDYVRWHGTWMRAAEPLTGRKVIEAFESKIGVSGYMMTTDNLTHVCAVDFDSDDGWDLARRLRDVMDSHHAFAYTEPSRRGAHLWSVLDRQIPARTVRRALRGFLAEALIAEGPKVELRPSHDEIKPDGYGSPIRMPTMPHPKTGKRYPLCGPDDKPLGGTLYDILMRIEWADSKAFEAMAAKTPLRVAELDDSYRPPKPKWPEGPPESASALLMALWSVQRAFPGHSIRCPAHDDKMPSLSILADDTRVICKAPGCILNNDDHGRGTAELHKLAPRRD